MAETLKKKLFLLDAYALIFRSYYAFIKNPRITSKGLNTSAVFGFVMTLEEVLKKQQPTHIAVAFDTPSPTFRHLMYSEYKANREATPEDIKQSVPVICRLLDACHIPSINKAGFEADDIIGTLAKKAAKNDFETYMMTPDKDYAQLVSDKIFMFKPSRGGNDSVIWNSDDVKREFSLADPLQVIDLLALMGDQSDNIPGAPGVGPKTAKKLIAEYGSVENILDNAGKLTGKLKNIIIDNADKIKLSKKLATIDTNVPLDFNEDDFILKQPDTRKLKALYEELEFRSFAAKLSVADTMTVSGNTEQRHKTAPSSENIQMSIFSDNQTGQTAENKLSAIDNIKHDYRIVSEESEIQEVVNLALRQKEVSFDTETTDIEAIDADLVAISVSWEKHKGFLIPFSGRGEDTFRKLNIIQQLLNSPSIVKIGQNIKYDIQVLSNYGVNVSLPVFDTMIAHYLIEPDMRHNMNLLAESYLSYRPVPIETLIGSKKGYQRNMKDVDVKALGEYAVEDADVTFQLKEVFEPVLKDENLEPLFKDIEMPLIPVLVAMERNGVILNIQNLQDIARDLRTDILTLEQEIFGLAGTEFNISSPKQLGDILFNKLKLDEKAKKTKTKQYSTDEDTLQRLRFRNPIIEKVLDYRGLKKLLSTYVEALPLLVNPKTGRIHTSFNQAVAATGRLSSANPNLQNIPVRDARGREIRKAFVPPEGSLFLSVDYSQVELRIMAHLSGDANMISDFLSGNDIHAATASKIFGVPVTEVTKDMRSKAKTANFGIIYGISAFGLAERLGIKRTEAKELIDGYFISYPGVKKYIEESIALARDKGYVTTIFGRRRYLRDILSRNQIIRGNAERNAINAPIQGSAADIIKKAMIRIHNRLATENFKTKMILQVHDELIFEVPENEMERLKTMVVSEMSGVVDLKVPLVVDCGIGRNWMEAH